MKKPNIKRLNKDPYFPQKERMDIKDVTKNFLRQEIIIMEKFDGKAHYDSEFKVLFEDLHHMGKDHLIKYTSDKWMLLAYLHKDNKWYPMVDEFYYSFLGDIEFFNDDKIINEPNFYWDVYERYPKFTTHEPLFRGKVESLQDLYSLIHILKYQKSQRVNNRGDRMEGVVLWSVETKVWAKNHNAWFSEELSKL